MLCPVCHEKPLQGRQVTCSTRCRSARYRERKQQRDTPQQGSGQGSTANGRASDAWRRSGNTSKLEQVVAVAIGRVIEALQRLGHSPAQRADEPLRVDLREQVASQAPKQASGYRIVLPGRSPSDAPWLTPKRSRTRDLPWYTLSPFEYPDDIRLQDGCWYRIVWVDAQGQRIRLRTGEAIPGLCYVVGPPQLRRRPPANSHAVTGDSSPEPARDAGPTPAIASSPPADTALSPSAAAAGAVPAPSGPTPPDEEEIIKRLAEEFQRAAERATQSWSAKNRTIRIACDRAYRKISCLCM